MAGANNPYLREKIKHLLANKEKLNKNDINKILFDDELNMYIELDGGYVHMTKSQLDSIINEISKNDYLRESNELDGMEINFNGSIEEHVQEISR